MPAKKKFGTEPPGEMPTTPKPVGAVFSPRTAATFALAEISLIDGTMLGAALPLLESAFGPQSDL
jgi:hypothetical protein